MDYTDDKGRKNQKKPAVKLTQKNTLAPAVVPFQTTCIRALCTNFTILQPAKLHNRGRSSGLGLPSERRLLFWWVQGQG